MQNRKIIVLMGGPSKEADISRNTGKAIAIALKEKGYDVASLELNPKTLIGDVEKLKGEVVFNAIHGLYGEDGAVQGMLEMANIPYTGSGITASALAMNKKLSKDIFVGAGIPTARSIAFNAARESKESIAASIVENFTFPVVVKAASQGSSLGVAIVMEEENIYQALDDVLSYGNVIIAEDYLDGSEFTVSVLNGEALPVIKIEPRSGIYDYTSKYTKGLTEYLVPAPISEDLTLKMQEIAKKTYSLLGCQGLARVDFMSDKKGEIYVLEVNTIPGMTVTSLAPKAANAVGISFVELCEQILASAGVNKF